MTISARTRLATLFLALLLTALVSFGWLAQHPNAVDATLRAGAERVAAGRPAVLLLERRLYHAATALPVNNRLHYVSHEVAARFDLLVGNRAAAREQQGRAAWHRRSGAGN